MPVHSNENPEQPKINLKKNKKETEEKFEEKDDKKVYPYIPWE